MTTGAMEQPHPQPIFQLGDTPAELGLWHVQRPARGGETPVLDHLGEVVKRVEVFDDRSPNRTLRRIFAV
ncbi:hypothetical protein D3C84_1112170 [compost metagenome]